MANAALAVIGLALGGVGMIPMLSNLFAPPADQITTVNMGVGFSTNLSDSLSGETPGVGLWDQIGRAIGSTPGSSHVQPSGSTFTVKVTPFEDVGNIPAEYIAVTNGGNDAICIAYLTVTFANGEKSSFSGDIGKKCGADWYPSSQFFGSDGFRPACIWLDRDHSNGLRHQGFGVHLPDFFNVPAKANQYNADDRTMCQSGPRFRMYEQLMTLDPILVFSPPNPLNPDFTDADPSKVIDNPGVLAEIQGFTNKKRDSSIESPSGPPNALMEGHLVVSAFAQDSAQEVCGSSTAKGPDFVSIQEGFPLRHDDERADPDLFG